jgi:hypothetical protein
MSATRKATVVHAALLLLTAWPLVHLGLVRRFDLSPWKLAGWGMYSAPRFDMIGMEIFGRDPATGGWEQLAAPSAELRATAAAFLERHRWLRGLADARVLVDAVAAAHPRWDAVRLVVAYPEIDRRTGMVVLTRDERRYGLR